MKKNNIKLFDILLDFNEAKVAYFRKPNFIDKILSITFLRLLPSVVTPNHLTLLRLILTPFVFFLLLIGSYTYGTILFIIAAFSDALDGARARTENRITLWGTLCDPIADKLLVSSVAVLLVSRYMSIALAGTIIFIELILVLSSYFRFKGKVVPAKASGKIKMVLQCVGIIFLLLWIVWQTPLLLMLASYTLYGAVFFALLSLLVYRSV
ncbi:MAG: CDP-diacylglycerol--glycerol-3-phosphate 3-phosphatidyltransferase [Candidatus Parcubacteria bacterium]|jgi:CDP-diacylglycerol--glycerol-3-phosphate 3-phosphatidyltransferase